MERKPPLSFLASQNLFDLILMFVCHVIGSVLHCFISLNRNSNQMRELAVAREVLVVDPGKHDRNCFLLYLRIIISLHCISYLYSETVSITTRPSNIGWMQQMLGMMNASGGQANPKKNITTYLKIWNLFLPYIWTVNLFSASYVTASVTSQALLLELPSHARFTDHVRGLSAVSKHDHSRFPRKDLPKTGAKMQMPTGK